MTALDHWYSLGRLTQAQHAALVAWRDDGGGPRRKRRRQSPQEGRQGEPRPEPDAMSQAARRRHKAALRDVERQAGQAAAKAVHRLVMCDDGEQRPELVQRAASVIWCWYSAE